MDALFGIPMNTVMLALVGALGVCLASVGYVVVRNRIMFFIGIRNIPRRMAQTVLIVVGLMLSTLIISAAFTTGDTVDASISGQTFKLMGHLDEVLLRRAPGGSPARMAASAAIPPADVAAVEEALADDQNVDGVLPVIFQPV